MESASHHHNSCKQIRCMPAFFQLFHPRHIFPGKRRLSLSSSSSGVDVDLKPELDTPRPASPAISRELRNSMGLKSAAASAPEPLKEVIMEEMLELPFKSQPPLRAFNLIQGGNSSWKFYRESPRLSLDSRATTDATGKLRPSQIRTTASLSSVSNRGGDGNESDSSDGFQLRSPSVIARLMGLEPLPDYVDSEIEKDPKLRRCASESRASRNRLFRSKIIQDSDSFNPKRLPHSTSSLSRIVPANFVADHESSRNQKHGNMSERSRRSSNAGFHSAEPWKPQQSRKDFFNSGDIFPEPKRSVSVLGEVEKRLRMRGFDQPSKDLEALKQILEALQLKGLLRSKKPFVSSNEISRRDFVSDESPTLEMKPLKLSISTSPSTNRGNENDYLTSNGGSKFRSVGRNKNSLATENSPTASPRWERKVLRSATAGRSSSSATTTTAGSASVRGSPNSLVKHKPLSIETQRKVQESAGDRRVSPIHSPRQNRNRSFPRVKQMPKINEIAITSVEEDGSLPMSGSSITITETEKSKDRCDKLLHPIAEINAQPSPVSILDSSFYKDDSFSPSAVTSKRNLDFKANRNGGMEEETWSSTPAPPSRQDQKYYMSEGSDMFMFLEEQQRLKGKDTCTSSKASRLQRKLIFDTTKEILDGSCRYLPPGNPSLDKVWSEFQRIRDHDASENLLEVICGVLKKDLVATSGSGWGMDVEGEVLCMERLVFKDLINESIAALACTTTSTRKLLF